MKVVGRLTFRHLSIFVCVCDTGNMTAAGEKLLMAQPSVSQAIMEMEKRYGVKLFERLGKKLYITMAGKKLLSYARHIINLHEEMNRGMQEIKDGGGVLRIGASVTIGACILVEIVQNFNKLYPNIKIETLVDNTKIIEEMLLVDEVDIGLIEGTVRSREIILQPFMDDELVLICGPQHRWRNKPFITISELENTDFVIREKGSGTRELFESVMAVHGIQWRESWICNNAETIKNAVQAGIGVSVISKMVVEDEVENGNLSIVKIKDVRFTRKFNIAFHKNKYITEVITSLIDCVNLPDFVQTT